MTRAAEIAKIIGKGSVDIHGEAGTTSSGSTGLTTNLQQGLDKAWVGIWDMAAASLGDSFNVASVTDEGTGRAYPNWTNAFANVSYVHNVTDDNYGMNQGSLANQTTTQARSNSYHSNFALQDAKTSTSAHGDLA